MKQNDQQGHYLTPTNQPERIDKHITSTYESSIVEGYMLIKIIQTSFKISFEIPHIMHDTYGLWQIVIRCPQHQNLRKHSTHEEQHTPGNMQALQSKQLQSHEEITGSLIRVHPCIGYLHYTMTTNYVFVEMKCTI